MVLAILLSSDTAIGAQPKRPRTTVAADASKASAPKTTVEPKNVNANPDVQTILDRVEAAGGKILVSKTEISPEHGYMGVFVDTEGNRIGLHSVPV